MAIGPAAMGPLIGPDLGRSVAATSLRAGAAEVARLILALRRARPAIGVVLAVAVVLSGILTRRANATLGRLERREIALVQYACRLEIEATDVRASFASRGETRRLRRRGIAVFIGSNGLPGKLGRIRNPGHPW